MLVSHTLSIESEAIPVFLGAPALEPVRLAGREGINSLFDYELPLRFALACLGLCIWANAYAAEPIWVAQKAVTSKYSFSVLVDTDDNGRHAEGIRIFDRKTQAHTIIRGIRFVD